MTPSDPLVGGLRESEGTDQWIERVRTRGPLERVVETRRLELLTLSLQRRCSAS